MDANIGVGLEPPCLREPPMTSLKLSFTGVEDLFNTLSTGQTNTVSIVQSTSQLSAFAVGSICSPLFMLEHVHPKVKRLDSLN